MNDVCWLMSVEQCLVDAASARSASEDETKIHSSFAFASRSTSSLMAMPTRPRPPVTRIRSFVVVVILSLLLSTMGAWKQYITKDEKKKIYYFNKETNVCYELEGRFALIRDFDFFFFFFFFSKGNKMEVARR
jgi:hypothetical protein